MTNSPFPSIWSLLVLCSTNGFGSIKRNDLWFFALPTSVNVISLQKSFHAHTFSFPCLHPMTSFSVTLLLRLHVLLFPLHRSWQAFPWIFSASLCTLSWLTATRMREQLLVIPLSDTALFQASGRETLNSVCYNTDTGLGSEDSLALDSNWYSRLLGRPSSSGSRALGPGDWHSSQAWGVWAPWFSMFGCSLELLGPRPVDFPLVAFFCSLLCFFSLSPPAHLPWLLL